MNTKVIGTIVALAVTITGAAFATTAGTAAERSKPQSSNGSNVYEMRLDRCPYYPSPVVCHGGSNSSTAQ
jgi:hypothetical protein